MQTETNKPKLGIIQKLLQVRQEIGAIGKNKKMDMGNGRGYAYRGIEDLYLAAQAALDRIGVTTVTQVLPDTVKFDRYSVTDKYGKEKQMTRCTGIVAVTFLDPDDGSNLVATGIAEGLDDSDKAAGKATSYGMKNVYFHTFVSPTEDPDASRPDTGNYKTKSKQAEKTVSREEAEPGRATVEDLSEAKYITEMQLATNMVELKAAWDAIPETARTPAVIEAKETRKVELGGKR